MGAFHTHEMGRSAQTTLLKPFVLETPAEAFRPRLSAWVGNSYWK